MTFELSPTGVTVETIDEIRDRMSAATRAPGGVDPNFDTSDSSPAGRLLGVLAIELAAHQKMVRAIEQARGPNAAGQALTQVSLLTGTVRGDATKSSVGLLVTLTDGTTLPAGSRANVLGDTSALFETLADVTNSSGVTDEFAVSAKAVTAGAVRAPSGTLTVISTPVSGWSAVTNPFDAELGSPADDDPALRLRREQELEQSGSTSLDAIVADVRRVEGVLDVTVYENDTDITDSHGRTPHSIELVIWDGASPAASDTEIAQTILDGAAAGIGSVHGDGGTAESGTAVDDESGEHTVVFTRAEAVAIQATIELFVDDTFVVGSASSVLAALADAAQRNQNIGRDFKAKAYYSYCFSTVQGVRDVDFGVAIAPDPPSDSVSITLYQVAVLDTADIFITVSPDVDAP